MNSENCPGDVLALVFYYVLDTPENQCKLCRRPLYWALVSRDAYRIRAVCVNWRRVFMHRVMAPCFSSASKTRWCCTPNVCAFRHLKQTENTISRVSGTFRMFAHEQQELIDLLVFNAGTSEEELDSSEEWASSSDTAE